MTLLHHRFISHFACFFFIRSSPNGLAAGFASATEAQARAWPELEAGYDVLISALTGSGKTLAAFLVCLDRLVRAALQQALADQTEVVYISPLKALSNIPVYLPGAKSGRTTLGEKNITGEGAEKAPRAQRQRPTKKVMPASSSQVAPEKQGQTARVRP